MRRFLLRTLPAVLALGACSGGQAPAPTPTPSPALRNPLNVALYPRSEIISVRSFRQVVTGAQTRGTVFADGAGTYDGQEVVAASGAPFSKLAAWVHHLGSHGLGDTHQYGFDYAAFERGTGKGTHGTLVIVMDPQIVDRQFGSVLDMIAKYRSLPDFMRAPIDREVKRRTGITLSDAMQPASPIGATLAALGDFEQRNSRGIVIVDAVRR
ncbi:MAG TPA: hypothetical protein VFW34_03255 [Candidatus Rubrimentiphilum sp.]|nr:hypothetical protein [Candidatus Rubrimentiphilum sp.]